MRDISKKVSVSLILLAIVLSVIFSFGIIQNIHTTSPALVTPVSSGNSGTVGLTLVKPKITETNNDAVVSLNLLPPRE